LGGLWAFKWAWHIAEKYLRCLISSGICMPNLNSLALIVSEISAFIRTDRQTGIARSTRLVIPINNIYTLWGRKRNLFTTSSLLISIPKVLLKGCYVKLNLPSAFLVFTCSIIHPSSVYRSS